MKVCFFSPYLPNSSVGGGEKHLFDIALVASRKYSVFIAINQDVWQDRQSMIEKYQNFLGKSLDQVTFIKSPLFSKEASFFKKLLWTKKFDYLFYWTDGSLFFSLAKINNLHFQIPFTNKLSFLDRIKLSRWQIKNSNSEFTKRVIEKHWQTKVDLVHHPLVNVSEFRTNQNKEKIILNVGRFFRQLHSKKQDVLVKLFEKLCDQHPELMKDYKLVLIGANEDEDYVREIKQLAVGLKIEIYHDISREELIKWYKKAQIYWHATGYGENELKNPEKVEHFGITTIEAMAAGAIPVVINKGGQREILNGELAELLWESDDQAIETTSKLISDPEKQLLFKKAIKNRLIHFDQPEFEQRVWEMFEHSV